MVYGPKLECVLSGTINVDKLPGYQEVAASTRYQ